MFNNFQTAFNKTQNRAITTANILRKEIDVNYLSPEQQQKYQAITKNLQKILTLKLEST
jgi:hypothetical protein